MLWFRSVRIFCSIATLMLSTTICVCAQTNNAASKRVPSARVVIVEDDGATDGLRPVPEEIRRMVDTGITNLIGAATLKSAWLKLVSTNDTVGIKVFSAPGANAGTRVDVVAAIVEGLLAAGLPTNHIVVWDKQIVDLRMSGFYSLQDRYGVRLMGSIAAGYDPTNFYETALLGTLDWTDSEFGSKGAGVGRKSFVTTLVSRDMTKIISVVPLMHHNFAGVSGNLYSIAMGSVDNTLRFENDPGSLNRCVPEIYALPILGDRVVLNVVDALICQYEGQDKGLLHYSTVLDELRFSRDPVALDVLSFQEIDRQRQLAGVQTMKTNLEIFVNASLLEIGVSDPLRIDVDRIKVAQTAVVSTNAVTGAR